MSQSQINAPLMLPFVRIIFVSLPCASPTWRCEELLGSERTSFLCATHSTRLVTRLDLRRHPGARQKPVHSFGKVPHNSCQEMAVLSTIAS